MKKILYAVCIFVSMLTLISCRPKNTIKVFNQGDMITKDGIVYTYYDKDTLYKTSIPFVEEAKYKPYYNYYYYDMSDYKDQKEIIPFEGDLMLESIHPRAFNSEIFLKFLKYSDPVYSPQTAYFYRLKDFFSLDLLGEGFIVTGYTKDLKKQVEIPKLIEGKPVLQIGFKAFENAPMESFTFISKSDYLPLPGIIHPYAFSNCENLSMIKSDCRVLSMGISNCSKLEEIYNITPTTDCSLYNLPSLIRIKDCDPRPIESQMGDRYTGLAIRATSGLRKSSIYLCPNLSVLTGTMLSKRNNVIFYGSQFPYYTFDHYDLMLKDIFFNIPGDDAYKFVACYDEHNELYLPFLNHGLNYKGTLFLDPLSEKVEMEEDSFFTYITYPKIEEGMTYFTKDSFHEPIYLKLKI